MRRTRNILLPRPCGYCGHPYAPRRSDGLFCSPFCNERAQQRKRRYAVLEPTIVNGRVQLTHILWDSDAQRACWVKVPRNNADAKVLFAIAGDFEELADRIHAGTWDDSTAWILANYAIEDLEYLSHWYGNSIRNVITVDADVLLELDDAICSGSEYLSLLDEAAEDLRLMAKATAQGKSKAYRPLGFMTDKQARESERPSAL